jgi:CheY-like chemotaxis protein
MKILAAEDHGDTALVYKYSLEDKGHTVTLTTDGKNA